MWADDETSSYLETQICDEIGIGMVPGSVNVEYLVLIIEQYTYTDDHHAHFFLSSDSSTVSTLLYHVNVIRLILSRINNSDS